MRIRSFIIAYALVLAILLFADRRPGSTPQDRYSHVIDLTDGRDATAPHSMATESRTTSLLPVRLFPELGRPGRFRLSAWWLRWS